MFRYLTAGESHGPQLTTIIEGLPAGIPLREEEINRELARRQCGYGRGGRMLIEKDVVEILSGVRWGETLGSPVTLAVKNKDWANWQEKMSSDPKYRDESICVTRARPGHADLAGALKYDHRDVRNILERSSARETAVRVAVGAVCKHFLAQFGIVVGGYVSAIGEIATDFGEMPYEERFVRAEESGVRCPIEPAASQMRAEIEKAIHDKNTLGGVLEIVALNVPVGLGSFAQWDKRLEAKLAAAVMSVQAIKGVEVGDAAPIAHRDALGAEIVVGGRRAVRYLVIVANIGCRRARPARRGARAGAAPRPVAMGPGRSRHQRGHRRRGLPRPFPVGGPRRRDAKRDGRRNRFHRPHLHRWNTGVPGPIQYVVGHLGLHRKDGP